MFLFLDGITKWIDSLGEKIPIDIQWIMLWSLLGGMILFIIFKIIRSVKFGKESKKYVDSNIGDKIFLPSKGATFVGWTARVHQKNSDGTYDILIKNIPTGDLSKKFKGDISHNDND